MPFLVINLEITPTKVFDAIQCKFITKIFIDRCQVSIADDVTTSSEKIDDRMMGGLRHPEIINFISLYASEIQDIGRPVPAKTKL